jgi:hypothetical protein
MILAGATTGQLLPLRGRVASVKLRHGAIALGFWYLFAPTIENQRVMVDRPLSAWQQQGAAFYAADECARYRQKSINNCDTGKYDQAILGSGFSIDERKLICETFRQSRCIESDDPRLRGK